MAGSFRQQLNGLSPVERLKATDKYLTEMRGVLASMDEIAALRKQRGEPESDEYGGYKRSSVLGFISELEKQKEGILAEIAREEKEAAERKREQENAPAAAAVAAAKAQESAISDLAKKQESAISDLAKKVDALAVSKQDSAVEGFRKGDPSLAIESMYTGLSMDIEKMRDDVLQELKYAYKQDMAIYDDLSAKIDAIKGVDGAAIEESLRPIGDSLSALDKKVDAIKGVDEAAIEESLRPIGDSLTALDKKVDAIVPVDYEALADKVAARVVTAGIDYDVLAQRIVGIMTGAQAPAQQAPERDLSEMERKIDSIKATLDGAVSVRQMPEFRKLDVLIADFLRNFSYDLIADILLAANAAKDVANRYIVSGNVLRGETMLADLRMRLSRVNVYGSAGIEAVSNAVSAHNLPLTYSPEALSAFGDAVREFEQSPALPPEDVARKVLATKKALFSDTDMEAMDRDTLSEILEIGEEVGEEQPDQGKVENLTELKKELMSFNLSYFVDLSPALPEEKAAEAPAASVDTQVILDAIARLGSTVTVAAAAAPAEEKGEDIAEKIAGIAKERSAIRKPRQLRAAVSSKDSKVEKTEQPLRTVKRKISLNGDDPDALSKQLVEELAVRIANSRLK